MRNLAFHDLPQSAFPFKIEFFNATGDLVHAIEVSGPGAVEVPGLRPQHGPVAVRVTYADGSVVEQPAPSP